MAVVMLESAACDQRLALKHSFFLAHNGSTSVKGTVEEIQESKEILDVINEGMAQIVGSRTFDWGRSL